MKIFKIIVILTFALVIFNTEILSAEKQISNNDVDEIVKSNKELGKLPGVSVVVVDSSNTLYKKNFGYIDKKRKVNSNTLFEVGSNSKAFTSMGILELQEEGKLNIDDPVKKYIKDFSMIYKGNEKDITIKQLMQHTSGIPFESITKIKPDDSKSALNKTVKGLEGQELNRPPGEKFEYATINYDVLGKIIEEVSGEPYDEYMNSMFKKYGLNNTKTENKTIKDTYIKGYKLGFAKPNLYNAPTYNGNKPAGYIVMNSTDMSKWLIYQLNNTNFNKYLTKANKVPKENNTYYNSGWYVKYEKNKIASFYHGGSNPNFSSFFLLNKKNDIGIGVLTNLNSAYTENIAKEINERLVKNNNDFIGNIKDPFQLIDYFSILFINFILVIFLTLEIFSYIKLKNMKYTINSVKSINTKETIFLASVIFVFLLFLPKILLSLLDENLTWSLIFIWGPTSVKYLAFNYYLFIISCFSIFYITFKKDGV
ncbi:beta-lactamase [Staphylococcus epidermidis]|uniref:serine hydrolase domain-containing protein n=1 Tax=Staphylococcus epidermidis TaxID=1282 RepID=UPI000E03C376|nr:serine hydrolase domain-containing protein [Staphylococcus epidermidis]SUM53494.1 beta-lactamase [Staphylococcus epidermidis]